MGVVHDYSVIRKHMALNQTVFLLVNKAGFSSGFQKDLHNFVTLQRSCTSHHHCCVSVFIDIVQINSSLYKHVDNVEVLNV
jgi:hypothetical protein